MTPLMNVPAISVEWQAGLLVFGLKAASRPGCATRKGYDSFEAVYDDK